VVLKPSYSVAYSVGNGFFMVNEGGIPVLQYIIMGNWKVVDQTGKVVLELGDYNNFLCDPFIIYYGLGESFTLYTPAGALIVGGVSGDDTAAQNLLDEYLNLRDIAFPRVEASSTLAPIDSFTYYPQNAADKDFTTAWVEGAAGNGENEWLMFSSDTPVKIHSLIINNGYGKTEDLYFKNSRIKTMRLEFSDGTTHAFELPDNYYELFYYELPNEVLTSSVKCIIESVYPGNKYQDTCLSEISFFTRSESTNSQASGGIADAAETSGDSTNASGASNGGSEAKPRVEFIDLGLPLEAEPSIKSFSEGLAAVFTQVNGTVHFKGYIDKNGRYVIGASSNIQFAGDFHEGLARFSSAETGKYGFIDKTGKVVVPAEYEAAWDFSEGLAAVAKDGKLGFIDKTGSVVIPLQYNYETYGGYRFSNGLAVVTAGDFESPDYMVIDKTGKPAFDFEYDYAAASFSEGLLVVGSGGQWAGENVKPYSRSFIGGKYGVIDTNGNELVPPVYDSIKSFLDGIAVVCNGGKYGAIDKTGRVVVPIIYDSCGQGSNGRLRVKNSSGKWGYVDYNGNVVIDFNFDSARDFNEGFAVSQIGFKWGAVDKTGKTIIPFEYDNLGNYNEGLAMFKKDSKYGYMDTSGKVVIDPAFDFSHFAMLVEPDFCEGVAIVVKDGRVGLIHNPFKR
jgi:hypothetical protein